jgi:hypothetical protein
VNILFLCIVAICLTFDLSKCIFIFIYGEEFVFAESVGNAERIGTGGAADAPSPATGNLMIKFDEGLSFG